MKKIKQLSNLRHYSIKQSNIILAETDEAETQGEASEVQVSLIVTYKDKNLLYFIILNHFIILNQINN